MCKNRVSMYEYLLYIGSKTDKTVEEVFKEYFPDKKHLIKYKSFRIKMFYMDMDFNRI